MAHPEKVRTGKGQEYRHMEESPSSTLRTFTLPGAAQHPSEAMEIKILDKENGKRSNNSESPSC